MNSELSEDIYISNRDCARELRRKKEIMLVHFRLLNYAIIHKHGTIARLHNSSGLIFCSSYLSNTAKITIQTKCTKIYLKMNFRYIFECVEFYSIKNRKYYIHQKIYE